MSYFSEQLPALETSVLLEEGFHSVYVSAVENPGLFFVQLKSSEERLVMCKPTSLFTFQVFLFGGLHEAKFFLCFFCYFAVIVVVNSFLPICRIEKNSQNR